MERGEKSGLESSLIPSQELDEEEEEEELCKQNCCRGDFIEEAKKQLWLAGPLVAVSMLQYCLQVISVMCVGHLGELALSSASMASSFGSVTGFSVLVSSISSFIKCVVGLVHWSTILNYDFPLHLRS